MNIVLNGLKVTQDRFNGNHIADCLAVILFYQHYQTRASGLGLFYSDLEL